MIRGTVGPCQFRAPLKDGRDGTGVRYNWQTERAKQPLHEIDTGGTPCISSMNLPQGIILPGTSA
ncbi:MAG TPA: hypothetical protein VK445_01615, partial [Dissulfurispiraceae bacterium]|nr:hypothetical protein [Dissulfurispiraceae bacterium]